MDHLIYLFAAVVLLSSALTGITIWATKPIATKITALVLSALLMLTAYGGLTDLLGKPKAVHMEWVKRHIPEATVLGVSMEEKKAIYLWLRFDGEVEPRAYVLPWSQEKAQQVQKAMREARRNGTAVRMRRPFERDTNDSEAVFYAEPQPAMPPKTPVTG